MNDEKIDIRKFTLDKLRQQARIRNLRPRTRASQDFFRDLISNIDRRRARTRMDADPSLRTRGGPVPGELMYFRYEALTYPKQTPFYDEFPLTLIIANWVDDKTGHQYFDGVNFHYLPIEARYSLMQRLLQAKIDDAGYGMKTVKENGKNVRKRVYIGYGVEEGNKRGYTKDTKVALTLASLQNSPELMAFQGAYRKYRIDGLRSEMRAVDVRYMDIAINLPLAKWVGPATDATAWKYARDRAKR